MVDFAYPHEATAGQAIEASKHNDNWNRVKNFINGDPGNLASYPGLLRAVDPSATGTLTATGTVSLGATNHFYLNSTQHNVIGLSTGTNINAETAGNFLVDQKYRAGWTYDGVTAVPAWNTTPTPSNLSWNADVASGALAGNYLSEKHRYSVYSRRAGEGLPAGSQEPRPESEYRLVVNGSIAVRGDIIGYTSWNDHQPQNYPAGDYQQGSGTRINCQWLNVRANVDIGGELRVQTSYDSAKIYMGNDYYSSEDYIEWKDNLDGSSLPGFQFVHNSNKMLQISESGAVGSEKLDLRAYKASSGASQGGWPTLSGTTAVITTTGTEQLGIQSSSIRFKEDVEDLETEENWIKLRALKPRAFRWNEEVATQSGMNYETQVPELGFIAEEVHEAVPEATMYDWSGDPIVYRDKSMLAMLVKAVQDIDERLGALE